MATILIADDEPALRDLLNQTLEPLVDEGHEVVEACDGVEAIERVREFKPDILLLDVMMPRMNGYQVCEVLRSDPAYDTLPILFLTARASEFDRARGHMVGGDRWITKPYDPDGLLEAVRALLQTAAASKSRRGGA